MLDSLTSVLQLDTASIIAGLVAAGCLAFFWSKCHAADAQQLPGPPGHWIIGNALDMPHEKEWIVHEKWKRQYGMSIAIRTASVSHVFQDRLWL
jgi:hypothetical protein